MADGEATPGFTDIPPGGSLTEVALFIAPPIGGSLALSITRYDFLSVTPGGSLGGVT